MSLFNYFKKVPKSIISKQNSSGNISSGSRGEPGERYPPPRNPENLQRMGNSLRISQQWESILEKISSIFPKFY